MKCVSDTHYITRFIHFRTDTLYKNQILYNVSQIQHPCQVFVPPHRIPKTVTHFHSLVRYGWCIHYCFVVFIMVFVIFLLSLSMPLMSLYLPSLSSSLLLSSLSLPWSLLHGQGQGQGGSSGSSSSSSNAGLWE
jgi:hypothetical protein